MGNLDLEGVGKGEPLRKRSWLFFLLVFSLALNLGTIGTLAYLRRPDVNGTSRRPAGPPLTVKELCRSLNLETEQCQQFRRMMSEHHQQRRDLQGELARQRQELLSLMKQDPPSWPQIQDKIKEISTRQGKLEEETVRLLMESMKGLTAEQRAAMFPLLERRLNPSRSRGGGRARQNKL